MEVSWRGSNLIAHQIYPNLSPNLRLSASAPRVRRMNRRGGNYRQPLFLFVPPLGAPQQKFQREVRIKPTTVTHIQRQTTIRPRP